MNVLIVGGGIAGVLLAILLERKGYAITLIEQSKEWGPVGGGITITLNGVKVLTELGLADEILRAANEIRNIIITNQHGDVLSGFNLDTYAADYAATITILRPDLHAVLIGHLRHTKILLDTQFVSIVNEQEGVHVTLSNGEVSYYDLVAGCDGINSTVRNQLFAGAKKVYAGYSSWRFVVDNVAGVVQSTITEMWGRGKRFGVVPITGGKVHCFASINTVENSSANFKISIESFKKMFACFGGPVPALINAIEQQDDLIYNDLEDIYLQKWHDGRVVLIGDAAHGMTPNMTQGASMAIEDAYELAGQLTDRSSVQKALAEFYEARVKRVGAVQRKSNLLGRVGQISNPVLCGIRNFCWKQIPDKWIQNDLKSLLINDASV